MEFIKLIEVNIDLNTYDIIGIMIGFIIAHYAQKAIKKWWDNRK